LIAVALETLHFRSHCLVNAAIRQGFGVRTAEQTAEQAMASGAIADFAEKYGEMVRVVSIGDHGNNHPASSDLLGHITSYTDDNGQQDKEDAARFVQLLHAGELCGGTHADSTAEIFAFHIVRESGIGAGTRRIEALAGNVA
jgi:alanyl-tRNA synthetase